MNRVSDSRGYSLIEVLMVIALTAVVCSFAVGLTMSAVNAARTDGSTTALMTVLELARNQSTSQRRDVQLVFTAPNQVQAIRLEIPSGTTVIATRFLEGGQVFTRFSGLPDTPDAFGHAEAIAFGSTPTIRFTSDGTLIDSSGDVLNGTVFLGIPDQVSTARAITIFGATGLIRSWKWMGSQWSN